MNSEQHDAQSNNSGAWEGDPGEPLAVEGTLYVSGEPWVTFETDEEGKTRAVFHPITPLEELAKRD